MANTPAPSGRTNSEPTGEEIVREAMKFEGDPYVWGAAGPRSFDCSGLTKYVLGQLGVDAPRTSQDQWAWVKRVPASQVTAGDLVFFAGSDPPSPGHVGIVTGPGTMIDAPHTGTNVQVDKFSVPGTGDMRIIGYGRPPGTVPGPAENEGSGGLPGQAAVSGALGGVASSIGGLADDFEGLAKVITWLTVPTHWVRIFAGVAGAGFLAAGVWFLMREAAGRE